MPESLRAILLAVCVVATGCGGDDTPDGTLPDDPPPQPSAVDDPTVDEDPEPGHQTWTVRIIERRPHDPDAFTQGLELTDAGILESTGLRGASTLRLVDAESGEVLRSASLDDEYFGEGLTGIDGEVVQLTWQAGVAFRYDAATFAVVDTHTYDGEGWGLCHDGHALWMSDGTSTLTRRDATTFEPLYTVQVRREGAPVARLNELECIDGAVWANVWQTDDIVVIDPASGDVRATIDASALRTEIAPIDSDAVLNGIADLGDNTVLLTGKLWPTGFVVEVVR